MKILAWFLSIFFVLHQANAANYHIVGYYENWAQYRTAAYGGAFACKPQNLSNSISGLTVLNYAFGFFNYGYVDGQYVVTGDWEIYPSEWNDIIESDPASGLWNQANALKTTYPSLEVMLSIGGWDFCTPGGSYGDITYTFFHQMASSSDARLAFINSAIDICETYGFDGLDIDWEYPASDAHGGDGSDYQNFYTFLQECSAAFLAHSPPLNLTMASPAVMPSDSATGSYTHDSVLYTVDPDDPATYFRWLSHLSTYLDWFNTMCYDYYAASYSTVTADNAPLIGYMGKNSVQGTIASYINAGVSPAKIVVGMPSYGHTFQGVSFTTPWDEQQPYGPGSSFTAAGNAGPLTEQSGFLSYIEIAQDLLLGVHKNYSQESLNHADPYSNNWSSNNNWTPIYGFNGQYDGVQYNPNTGTAYAYNKAIGMWVSFDTPQDAPYLNGGSSSIVLKCNYIKEQGLGGAMLWSLDDDYFRDNTTPNILQTMVNTLK